MDDFKDFRIVFLIDKKNYIIKKIIYHISGNMIKFKYDVITMYVCMFLFRELFFCVWLLLIIGGLSKLDAFLILFHCVNKIAAIIR